MTDTVKKQWSTPRLRIFVRTRAEERVLAGCKGDIIKGEPFDTWNGCYRTGFVDAPCAIACTTIANS